MNSIDYELPWNGYNCNERVFNWSPTEEEKKSQKVIWSCANESQHEMKRNGMLMSFQIKDKCHGNAASTTNETKWN